MRSVSCSLSSFSSLPQAYSHGSHKGLRGRMKECNDSLGLGFESPYYISQDKSKGHHRLKGWEIDSMT